MTNPKIIMLYGFASSGKTTLAKKYIDVNPLSIAIEGDQIISMMGKWRDNEAEARDIVFAHTKLITDKHISLGHTVLLPYLLTDRNHPNAFKEIAERNNVPFQEIYINLPKQTAIERLLERGVWGEEGSPELTANDLPEIANLFETMEKAMEERESIKTIDSIPGDIDETYNNLLSVIENHQ